MHPASHAQILSAYVGKLNFEFSEMVDTTTGKINTGVVHHWLLQLHTDFEYLFDKVEDLSLDANIIVGRYVCLFTPPGVDAQLNLAVEHVRDFDLSAIKPICLALSFHESNAPVPSEDSLGFVCPVQTSEGVVCLVSALLHI